MRRLEEIADWFAAWFGGSAVAAFQLGHPDDGWMWAGLSVAAAICGIVFHLRKRAR